MIKNFFLFVFLGCLSVTIYSQTLHFADSIRKAYQIPELGYAVISSEKVYEMQVLGIKRIHSSFQAEPNDQFRIGSNTKAITGFIAALLVKQNKIGWDTKFFDLYPELKPASRKAYHELSLLNLLSFRTRLYPYTYTYTKPTREQFTGDEQEQRYQFAAWFFKQQPVPGKDTIHFSNLGYIAAGLMMEKVSGKLYKQLVNELGELLNIHFGFGAPNSTDTLQPWGHDQHLVPEAPDDNYKLDWLLPAGNIHVSLPDYTKFIQLQLRGLAGRSEFLSKEEFEFLYTGLPVFSAGWFRGVDENGKNYSYNTGNPGTFLSKVYVFKDQDLGFIFFTNAQTEETNTGIDLLYAALKNKYLVP